MILPFPCERLSIPAAVLQPGVLGFQRGAQHVCIVSLQMIEAMFQTACGYNCEGSLSEDPLFCGPLKMYDYPSETWPVAAQACLATLAVAYNRESCSFHAGVNICCALYLCIAFLCCMSFSGAVVRRS